MRIGEFLDSLQDEEVKYLVGTKLENISRRVELPGDPKPYFDEETGNVRRDVELDDDFLHLIIDVIAEDTMSEPTSENEHLGFCCPGTYAEYLKQYDLESDRGMRVTNFLGGFLVENECLTSAE